MKERRTDGKENKPNCRRKKEARERDEDVGVKRRRRSEGIKRVVRQFSRSINCSR